MNNFKIQYLIELECIDEANEFGLKLGEKGYAVAFAASDFTRDINNCNVYDDFDTAVFNARLVYKRGDFMPRIREIVRKIGPSVDFCLAA